MVKTCSQKEELYQRKEVASPPVIPEKVIIIWMDWEKSKSMFYVYFCHEAITTERVDHIYRIVKRIIFYMANVQRDAVVR